MDEEADNKFYLTKNYIIYFVKESEVEVIQVKLI